MRLEVGARPHPGEQLGAFRVGVRPDATLTEGSWFLIAATNEGSIDGSYGAGKAGVERDIERIVISTSAVLAAPERLEELAERENDGALHPPRPWLQAHAEVALELLLFGKRTEGSQVLR